MKNLPIMDFKNQIIDTVSNNPVTVIEADTGAGKSTSVPQFLYEAGFRKITITQPRAMAAVSLAEYVAEEMNEEVGITVGYKTRFQKTTGNTPITYVSDGYLLATYMSHKEQEVIILDEAHEFNLNEEILLGLYKKELKTNPNLKLVVMSATIDSQKLSEYFDNAPVISVPGKVFPVAQYWEPDLKIEDCICKYFSSGTNMLVFLPGKEDIIKTNKILKQYLQSGLLMGVPEIFQLHGEMNYMKQKNIFRHHERGKIILATNVAQTSITIPDIDFVIDSGSCKEKRLHNGISKLCIVNISQADCAQRAGRAGRCKPGTYVLCSNTDSVRRPAFSTPEIQRTGLDDLVLKLATMNIDPMDIEFIHNPNRENIKFAKQLLVTLGALNKDGSITKIGIEMEQMHISSRIARMLVEAQQFSPEVQGDMAIIAAILECGDFRATGFRNPNHFSKECLMSDVTYQLQLLKDFVAKWETASDEERSVFYRVNHIKSKIYHNILTLFADIADKLCLENMLGKQTLDEDFSKIRQCIVSAYPDSIYVFCNNFQGPSYFDISNKISRQLERNSVFSSKSVNLPKFIFAQPMDLEVKQRRSGYHARTLTLLKNITAVELSSNPQLLDRLLQFAELSYYYDRKENVLYDIWQIDSIEIYRNVSSKVPNFMEVDSYSGNDKYVIVMVEGKKVDIIY